MRRRSSLLVSLFVVLATTGCIKETYDMNKLSKEEHLSPTMAISAIKGDVSLSDMVKSNDTLVFDQNKFVTIVFKKDSVINLKLTDYFNLNNMVSFSQSYTLGDLSLSDFQSTIGIPLSQISLFFSPALKAQFVALDNGSAHPFPPFPSVNLGENTFPVFSNFQNAVFRSGFIDISITNNLTAPLNNISVNLYNSSGHTAIGTGVTIPASQPGETKSGSIDLTGQMVTNSVIAAIVLSGSPGNATPVLISLNNSNIQISVRGRDLIVESGRVILPAQTVTSLNDKDTVDFDPGSGIELDQFKVTTGNFAYHVKSTSALAASLEITMPTTLRSGTPVSELINIGPISQSDGSISFNNTTIDLGADIHQPFNRVPITYGINVNSNGNMINFNSTDQVQLSLKLLNPVFDFVKGYFGQTTETFKSDSIKFDINNILSHITGSFLISNPSIKLYYSNSFAIPIQLNLSASGKRGTNVVNLGLAPFTIHYPVAPASRDVSDSLIIDKTTSTLPALISMPPEEIRFSGSAMMNPAGNDGLFDNYVFGNSRFYGSCEVEVPMQFRATNLQFTDTVNNFLEDNNSITAENFDSLRINFAATNGFPFGVSLKVSLYDTLTHSIKSTINATGILAPAPVDANGKVSGVTETSTNIEFTKDFFSSIGKEDKIIFQFTLNTTGSGSQDVKIYSDYRIVFNAALVVKPDINLK